MPNAMFRVEVAGGAKLLCHVTAQMRMHTVAVLPGDTVTVEPSSNDPTRGRIVRKVK